MILGPAKDSSYSAYARLAAQSGLPPRHSQHPLGRTRRSNENGWQRVWTPELPRLLSNGHSTSCALPPIPRTPTPVQLLLKFELPLKVKVRATSWVQAAPPLVVVPPAKVKF